VYNVRSLLQRRITTGVTVAGLGLVAGVFAAVLMLSTGIDRTLASTGSPENVKVIRKGSQTETQSGLQPEHLRLLSSQPEVAKAAHELVVLIYALKEGAADDTEGSN